MQTVAANADFSESRIQLFQTNGNAAFAAAVPQDRSVQLTEANETKTPVSTKVGRFRETGRAVLHGGAERVSIQRFVGPPVQCRDVNVRSNEGEKGWKF